ncbi:D-threo-aldose 1-dehydrogenase [Arthrobacter globiformis]|uniref:aldo/keto reductase n=1 Tax=Arthrobacter globiformis TaxID=1665 RepID=UPI0027811299|nr:aldo/keto reductase [Arthrobacter globiformis]MDQ1060485.1 D-threo-aldose 1-dehydrogenase [Arthrobacter globiformis]
MAPLSIAAQRTFGRAGWSTTLAGFGSVALGNMGKVMPTTEARNLVNHAWESGVRLFDTAPMYGHGLAEYRLADELMDRNRDEYALVTKVGRTLHPAPSGTFDAGPWKNTPPMRMEYDYSYDGVMRQVEDSMQRMATDRFDVLLVHDTDRWTHGDRHRQRFQEAIEGAFRALLSLREQKVVSAIGIGVNEVDVCINAVNMVDIDCTLIAGTYNLLDQEAAKELLPLCQTRGIAVINGRVFGSGILATGTIRGARFNYAPASAELIAKVRPIEDLCGDYGVSLGAVAVQFAASHPAISNVCMGAGSVEQQKQNYSWLEEEVPDGLWNELTTNGLLPAHTPFPVEPKQSSGY